MPAPIWKGFITFGLVNIPVVLYSAQKGGGIRFHMVDSRDKSRIRYVRINEHTGKEVPWKRIAKAYEYDKDDYILLDQDELKKFEKENSRTIQIESFVSQDSLDCTDFETPYYLVPDKNGEKGYIILRETMKETKKLAITRVMIHTREYLAALIPKENALILNLLRYHDEIKKLSEYEFPDNNTKKYKISPKELSVAKELVASMTEKWKPDSWHDETQNAIEKWIETKIKHHKKSGKTGVVKKQKSEPVRANNIINFVDLMKKSLKTGNHKKIAHRGRK